MNKLYPLKFKPILKEKIWGGNKIKEHFNIDFSPYRNCGEAWLISGIEGENSIITNGFLADNELNEILEIYMTELVGEKNYYKYKNRFPLLIKIIDANNWLSVQVHPDDKLARKTNNENGKTEMWYINKAEPGAEIVCGFNRELDKEGFKQYIEKGQIEQVLNFEKVAEDDVIYLPAGRVHATGAGILLTEIQQTSDITYRIYDWKRKDEKGETRELHLEEANTAIDFKPHKDYKIPFRKKANEPVQLVSCEHFTTNLMQINKNIERDYNILDSFVILIGQKGEIVMKYEGGEINILAGEATLIPATITEISLIPEKESEVLEVYI